MAGAFVVLSWKLHLYSELARMGDDSWTVNLFMKDAPSHQNFLEQTMDRDLICYFDIFGMVEKYGYTTSDALYCKRDSHGRHKACLVKISNDNDVGKMLLEHEADRKLTFFVEKRTASLNTGVHFAAPTHTGSSDDAMEGYDTESSNESDHETDRDELDHESEAMKRRWADPSVHPKKHKRPRKSVSNLEDHDHGDLDDPLEPLQNGDEDEEILQDPLVDSENEYQDLAELDTTISGVSAESGSIKIVWPNGVIQEYRGRFTVSNVMNIKSGGKVIIETDENGVPNQRSAGLLGSFLRGLAKNSSHVPLHIPRWDNKLMRKPKENLITYVETKFVYPEETKYTTEGWILKIVNKGWRDYKSSLKKEYYKPNKWSLDRIMRRVPDGVNKHQWITLLETWCQEQHTKTCERNSEAGKQQRHSHTTGRKSHARLKKEMEVKNKGPVSKIDLWDEAHKKKDGTYTNENVQQLMHKARKELAILERKKNGKLSPEDYDKVFDDVIAKDSTIGTYYDEKYWGDARLCRGSTSVPGASSEVMVQNELQEMKADLKNVTGLMGRMCAFMARNHPGEDWMNDVMTAGNEIKKGNQPEDPAPMLQSNNITMNISYRFGGDYEVDGVERPMANIHTTGSNPKVTLQTMSLLLS